MSTITTQIETEDGVFIACFSENGLAALNFPGDTRRTSPSPSGTALKLDHWRRMTEATVRQALAGCEPEELPPLDLSSGTEFQQSVWQSLLRIPPGETRSYAQVAEAIGRPRAVRAVGQACGANPIPVLVPCHRVLAAGGKLGGFSSGLEWKRKLLAREADAGQAGMLSLGFKNYSAHRSSAAAARSHGD